MDQHLKSYESAAHALLLDFQWIEQVLRVVIGASYGLLSKAAPTPVRFSPNKSYIDRDALGKLIERFGEVSANETLIQELRVLTKDRNHVAHRAFVLSLEEQFSADFLKKEIERMADTRFRTRRCIDELMKDMTALFEALDETPVSGAERLTPDE